MPSAIGRMLRNAAGAIARNACVAFLLALLWMGQQIITNNWRLPESGIPWRFAWTEAWQAFSAFGIDLLFISAGLSMVPRRGRWRIAALTALWLLTCWLNGTLWSHIIPAFAFANATFGAIPRLSLFWQVSIGVATTLILRELLAQRDRQARESLHEAELQHVAAQTAASQSRIGLLEAQIEPHFLFNALANVRRLMRTDAAAAQSMIGDLLRYFEEALPRLRDPVASLAREAELVRAFLAVHQVRMGTRLAVDLDIPPELLKFQVPPMALLTLVENALKHGLQPQAAGGTLRLCARDSAGLLVLTVSDDGVGMGQALGSGMGLLNLRARLRALHGDGARLSLCMNEPRGVIVTLALPQVLA